MICFVLIAMIGSVMTLWVVKKIEKERFYSDIKRFKNVFLFCQKMAKVRQADIILKISQTPEGVKYEIENIALPIQKNLINYSSMKTKEAKVVKVFKVEFAPSGNIYPFKSIYFFSKKDKYVKEFNPKSL